MTPTLHTPRLVLRPLRLDDAPAIQRHFARWSVIEHLSTQVPWPYPDDGALTFVRDVALPAVAAGRAVFWALTLREPPPDTDPDEAIGLLEWRVGHGEDDRGFWLAEPHWGQGLMTEAVVAFQDWLFFERGWDRIRVLNSVDNPGSRRIKEKTGAVLIGEVTLPHRSGQTRSEQWEVTAERWAALRRGE